ncbi:integrase catalytic domain-containing protein [Trichonephila clavipes]|nr:integrase catalytic domain-containing protein [Trichonephila clavipes]
MTWERNRNHHELSDNTAGKNIRSLENLMTFLRQEVQGEEMVVLSRTGFASNNVTRKKEYVCTPLNEIREIRQLRQPCEDLEIDLLVGSNVLGRILMKKCCELDSGLSVVETKLGNTVIGMLDDVCHIDRNVMTTLSMYARNFKLTDLWSLESLGISNPTLEESKQNSYEDALNDFQQKLAILLTEENDVKVTLLRSKARVAPLKSLTIPRLELMSCCLGARLANSIIRALNLPGIKVIYWSDSEVALWWIREQGNWSVFVANRVKEIRELTQFQSWRHVPRCYFGKRKSELVNVNISEELVPWVHVEEETFELSSDDIENAERVLIRLVQDKMFPNLKSIPIVNVFKDNEGIIRVKTKITERR